MYGSYKERHVDFCGLTGCQRTPRFWGVTHVIVCVVRMNFDDKILLRGEECKTQENLNFSEKEQNGKLSLQYKL